MAVGNACHISEATAFHISSQLHTARRHMELIAYWCAGFLHAHHVECKLAAGADEQLRSHFGWLLLQSDRKPSQISEG
ncbi:hypothetical protein MHYP_G00341820 [Metynnis hypsauchen]